MIHIILLSAWMYFKVAVLVHLFCRYFCRMIVFMYTTIGHFPIAVYETLGV